MSLVRPARGNSYVSPSTTDTKKVMINYAKSNICWGSGLGVGDFTKVEQMPRTPWGDAASPTNQSSKLQGFYQREQLGKVVCSFA